MADDLAEYRRRILEEAEEAVDGLGDALADDVGARDHEGNGADDAPTPTTGAGRAYIDRMMESGNRVMLNPYGEPIVELICPRSMAADIEETIEEWDLNPSGHGILAQEPSFADQYPDVAEELAAWQFLLTEGEEDDLRSCGYDLHSIFDAYEDDPVMASKARRVQTKLPWE